MEETKVIYYKKDDIMPYLVKLNVAPDKAKLKHFKEILNTTKNYKYFYQGVFEEFGAVKIELTDDEDLLPGENGKVVVWLTEIVESTSASIVNSDNRFSNNLNSINEFSNKVNQEDNFNIQNENIILNPNNNINNNNINNNINNNNNNNNNKNVQNQVYDTLNGRKNSLQNKQSNINNNVNNRHNMLPLKDINFDDTITETESLSNAFDDLKVKQNNKIYSHHNSGSLKRNTKQHFGSFNHHVNNQNHHHNQIKPSKQKLSLDSQQHHHHHQQQQQHRLSHGHHANHLNHYTSHHQQQQQQQQLHHHHHHQQQQQQHQFNHYQNQIKHHHHHHNHHQQKGNKKYADSFSDDDDDDDESDILNDESNMLTRTGLETTGAPPSITSSEIDTTTFFDTENDEDDDGQFSSITAETTNSTLSSRRYGQNRNRKRLKHKLNNHHSNYLNRHNSLHSSVSSLTDSTMSLNIITVTLKMDTVNFLGISIVGQSNKGGEGGIYVGSIMSGGAVALDGRIEPGDMILQVNDISFEDMSNDDAVKVLREAVMKPGPVKLVVAKCWDPNPKGYFTVSKQEPVRPIDPSAWVAHTQAHTGMPNSNTNTNNHQIYQNGGLKSTHNRLTHSISSFGSNSSLSTSIADTTLTSSFSNLPAGHYNFHANGILATTTTTMNGGDSTRYGANEQLNLTTDTDMETVVRSMAAADSGLDIRDRNWLKITIPMAFIGSDVVDWLFNHVEGFPDRRDARKYACNLLKYGYIRHAVNKMRFSEQCYYVFGDFNQSTLNSQCQNGQTLFTLNEESEADFDSVSEFDRDTLYAPMNFPPPGSYNNANNIYQQHQPKIYSNLNGIGIGGPPPPPSYMSSSSSNATSNSTSTTSNNTTCQTIGTSTSALAGVIAQNGPFNNDKQSSCQLYYHTPPTQMQLTSFTHSSNNTNVSSSSMLFCKQDDTINQTGQYSNDQTNPANSVISQFSLSNQVNKNSNPNFVQNNVYSSSNSGHNRSHRSSDNSSSGNGSDIELLSSKSRSKTSKTQKTQQQMIQYQQQKQQIYYQQTTNYYEINQLSSTVNTGLQAKNGLQESRNGDKIPPEVRASQQACEFFIDVM